MNIGTSSSVLYVFIRRHSFRNICAFFFVPCKRILHDVLGCLLGKHLLKVSFLNRFNGLERIEQAAVVDSAVASLDLGMLCGDQSLEFQASHIFLYRVVAHTDGLTDGTEARMALEGFPVLAVHKIGIDENFARGQPQTKDAFQHWKIIAGLIPAVVIVFQ